MINLDRQSQSAGEPEALPESQPQTQIQAQGQPQPKPKQRRGFAAMDPRLVSEIASKGGRAAHAAGTAHEFSAEEARNAGRKGGLAPHTPRTPRARSSDPSQSA